MLEPKRGKAATALSDLREMLKARGATLDEMLTALRRLRETDDPRNNSEKRDSS